MCWSLGVFVSEFEIKVGRGICVTGCIDSHGVDSDDVLGPWVEDG